jgi:hypothetical protein
MCFDFRDWWLIPVLGDSQVLLRPIGSGFYKSLQELPWVFKLFFKRPRQGFQKFEKIFSLGFQSVGSHTFQTCQYSKAVVTYQFSKKKFNFFFNLRITKKWKNEKKNSKILYVHNFIPFR